MKTHDEPLNQFKKTLKRSRDSDHYSAKADLATRGLFNARKYRCISTHHRVLRALTSLGFENWKSFAKDV
jgi:hypothetical protein